MLLISAISIFCHQDNVERPQANWGQSTTTNYSVKVYQAGFEARVVHDIGVTPRVNYPRFLIFLSLHGLCQPLAAAATIATQ